MVQGTGKILYLPNWYSTTDKKPTLIPKKVHEYLRSPLKGDTDVLAGSQALAFTGAATKLPVLAEKAAKGFAGYGTYELAKEPTWRQAGESTVYIAPYAAPKTIIPITKVPYWMSEEYPFRADKLIAAEQLTKRVDPQRKPYSIKKSENPIKSLILQHGEETYGNSTVKELNITVNDTRPTTPTLTTNSTIHVGNELKATGSGSTDADNDTITYYYSIYNYDDGTIRKAWSTTQTYTINTTDAEDKLAGMLIGMIDSIIWDPDTRILREIVYWVDEEYRGSTAGYRLLAQYVKEAQEMVDEGRITAYSMVKMTNSPDLKFEKFGFKKTEEVYVAGLV